jgi:hypothetical protein
MDSELPRAPVVDCNVTKAKSISTVAAPAQRVEVIIQAVYEGYRTSLIEENVDTTVTGYAEQLQHDQQDDLSLYDDVHEGV